MTKTNTTTYNYCEGHDGFTMIVEFANGRKSFAVVGQRAATADKVHVSVRDGYSDKLMHVDTWTRDATDFEHAAMLEAVRYAMAAQKNQAKYQ